MVAPLVAALQRMGVTADGITIVGALGAVLCAITLFPLGYLWQGALLVGVFALSDALDGALARSSGTAGPWGAFLDATLDRLCDAAIFVGLALYFQFLDYGVWSGVGQGGALASLVFGYLVSYARARGEANGFFANVGLVERGERLVISLVAAFLVGVGLSPVVLAIGLLVIAAGSAATLVQRIVVVRRQARDGVTS